MKSVWILICSCVLLAACSGTGNIFSKKQSATAVLAPTKGNSVSGTVNFTQKGDVVLVEGASQLIEDLSAIDHGYWLSLLMRVIRDASGSDVLFALAAMRQRELPSSLCATMTTTWQLRPTHRDDLVLAGVPGALLTAAETAPAGRLLVDGRWAQICVGEALCGNDNAENAVPAAGLPAAWTLALDANVSSSGTEYPVIGLADLTGEMVTVVPRSHVLVVGPDGSGRSNALSVIASQWPGPVESLGSLDLASLDADTSVLLVVESAEVEDANNASRLDMFAIDRRVSIAVATTPARVERAFSGWLAEVKRAGRVLVLAPERAVDVELLTGQRVRLRPEQLFPPGRGVWVDRRSATLVQLPRLQ